MKKLNFLVALCCLLLVSCQVEQENVVEDTPNLTTTVAPHFGFGGAGLDPDDDSKLEQSLAWAAYTAGSILYENADIQLELEPYLNSTTKSLSLELLLNPNTDTDLFRNAFINRFQLFVDCSLGAAQGGQCPGGSNSPGDPACPPCTGAIGGGEALQFVNYLINDHCLEFYLPRGFQFDATDYITTAAHSMNDAFHTNKAFCFKYSAFQPLSNIIVSPSYVQTHLQTIIIGRPTRSTLNGNCDYTEINVIDFEDFLSGTWPFGI